MTATVISKQGETVDKIVFDHFGYTEGVLEQTLLLNKHVVLGDHLRLPTGIEITLPGTPETAIKQTVNLWD